MIFSNLRRRKGRTIITLVGISIGIAAVIALGAVAQGMKAGFTSATQGSQADLVLAQSGAVGVLLSSVDEAIIGELQARPEVANVVGVLFSSVQAENVPSFYIFGHELEGFSIKHFRVIEGQALAQARNVRGKPVLLGQQAAESLNKRVGDAFHVTGGTFRIVGIYETGDSFEDNGAVMALEEAQALTLQSRRVSVIYIKVRPSFAEDISGVADRLKMWMVRRFPDLSLFTTSEFVNQEQTLKIVEGMATGVAVIAVVIGGIVMTNTLFMSVFERTREIGLLRALGWRHWQVLAMILGESLLLALLGGLGGAVLGGGGAFMLSSSSLLGTLGVKLSPQLFIRGLVVALVLGLVGGGYPAWQASRLLPLEAMRYEGGRGANVPRFLPGGMVMRGLWRRRVRTGLTLLGIGASIVIIIALGALTQGRMDAIESLWRGSQTDLVALEADVSDVGLSAISDRVGSRIAARPDVEAVAGAIITFASTQKIPFLTVFGYHPGEFAVRRFRIIEGRPLEGSREVILGRQTAEVLGVGVGRTLRLLESNFRVVGIYETGLAFEETGVVIGLREAQSLTGRSHQVMWYGIKLRDAGEAKVARAELQAAFPDLTFSLTSQLTEDQAQFQQMQRGVDAVLFFAVLIGGIGILNTMLMSVLERTREIGVLRALGWRRRHVIGMILQESLILGSIGSISGILMGLGLSWLMTLAPSMASVGAGDPVYKPELFVKAIVVGMVAGVAGGLYPAWRAANLSPIEALQYE